MKAQELKTKTSANSDINDNSSEIMLRGRLLERFQDDAKYEHVGQDIRSQGTDILELADQSISTPTGIAEDVFVKVGTFFFLADFVVVDYVADPWVPLILRRPFLRTARALIDVHGEQMTLHHDDQSVTFKVGDTKIFSYNTTESVNRIDVINVACEEFA
ncbi:reverse transcriptase domain-containing protein [Tanacetum coccineum]